MKKSEHYEVELELNGRGISEFRKYLDIKQCLIPFETIWGAF